MVGEENRLKRKMQHGLFRETAKIFLNGVFFKNLVLIGALGLFPIVAAGYNVRAGLGLSFLLLFISLPVELLLCGIGGLLPLWARPSVVLAASALFYIPAAWLLDRFFPGSVGALGIFAGLMICNSMILSRANDYAPSHIFWAVLADVLGCAIGFSLLMFFVSAIREFLQRGSILNHNTSVYIAADRGTALPFFGFLLIGFAAAFLQWYNLRKEKRAAGREVHR